MKRIGWLALAALAVLLLSRWRAQKKATPEPQPLAPPRLAVEFRAGDARDWLREGTDHLPATILAPDRHP
ncbi:MAG: hypothetical protein KatS3mg110_3880 [Pirellulaceae bacterium]|nr:MAG: hypothetical protein KatS3mg110_3880 [Pirellulaceae bacterium]